MTEKNEFSYREVVWIAPKEQKYTHLHGKKGIVTGISYEDDGSKSGHYAVDIDGEEEGWCFDEDELESTGKFMEPGYNMTDTTVRVSVDKDGKGTLVGEATEDGRVIPLETEEKEGS